MLNYFKKPSKTSSAFPSMSFGSVQRCCTIVPKMGLYGFLANWFFSSWIKGWEVPFHHPNHLVPGILPVSDTQRQVWMCKKFAYICRTVVFIAGNYKLIFEMSELKQKEWLWLTMWRGQSGHVSRDHALSWAPASRTSPRDVLQAWPGISFLMHQGYKLWTEMPVWGRMLFALWGFCSSSFLWLYWGIIYVR